MLNSNMVMHENLNFESFFFFFLSLKHSCHLPATCIGLRFHVSIMGRSTWALKPDWIRIPTIRIYQILCSVHGTRVILAQYLTCIGGYAQGALALLASYMHSN